LEDVYTGDGDAVVISRVYARGAMTVGGNLLQSVTWAIVNGHDGLHYEERLPISVLTAREDLDVPGSAFTYDTKARTDVYNTMRAVFGYTAAHRLPCWVIHTPPQSTIGGFSAELVDLGWIESVIRIANGDTRNVPTDELSIRIGDPTQDRSKFDAYGNPR